MNIALFGVTGATVYWDYELKRSDLDAVVSALVLFSIASCSSISHLSVVEQAYWAFDAGFLKAVDEMLSRLFRSRSSGFSSATAASLYFFRGITRFFFGVIYLSETVFFQLGILGIFGNS